MPKRLISLVLLLVATAAWGNSPSEDTGDVIGCVDPGVEVVFIPVEEADITLLNTLKPMYPESLLGTGWTGECTVGLYIDEEGRVRKAWLIHSTGNADADGEALAAARASEWEPAPPDSAEIYRLVSVTVTFSPLVDDDIAEPADSSTTTEP